MYRIVNLLLVFILLIVTIGRFNQAGAQATCQGQFISVSKPLTELGQHEYVRLDSGPTGFTGGLYPNGSNVRPPAHNAAGLSLASQIAPLDASGNPDPVNGKIVMISVGMSNTSLEFERFIELTGADPDVNPKLVLVNGAQWGKVSRWWVDPDSEMWMILQDRLDAAGVTPQQVQAAWVKQAVPGPDNNFPAKTLSLQRDLEDIARNLKIHYPNIKIAYHSSRTRSYQYWQGLSPEPIAFESGLAVKWMIEKQINGDPSLNFDPDRGPVVAPFLTWGPYLWIDGLNPRSDGLTWPQEDLEVDCVHPTESGQQKVAEQLLSCFKTDQTATPWFRTAQMRTVISADYASYLPAVLASTGVPDYHTNCSLN